jgi:rubrerythrin
MPGSPPTKGEIMNSSELERIFRLAIARELDANTFYAGVAKSAKDPEVQKVFEQLAQEELGHFELLERFRSDPTLPLKIAAPKQDYKVAESVELPPFSATMKPAEAIALAMKKEAQAVEFYRGLAAAATDTELKSIFDNLANMELGHKHRLENVFVDIGYPEAF